ncbi:nitrogenase component 1 [Labilibaculum sp.]|uniref:nitrogenase component 1 n=1 Tax=Labilibaculum sp. TaxID=2060723 RepID=UPI003562CF32
MEKIPTLSYIKPFVSTRNACKLCSPLGACIAIKGIEGCVPVIHGSQGCATYIRRYMISHYKEPVDIASSNFSEETTIFGGQANLKMALTNVSNQYQPMAIGVATTCLSETIGEDVASQLSNIRNESTNSVLPDLFTVSTPSYQGTHMDGFHATILEVVKNFAVKLPSADKINFFPGFISPADIRHLKEILSDFDVNSTILPDYSDTLDNPIWDQYYRVPKGGTSISELKKMGEAYASVELGLFTAVKQGGQNGRKEISGASYLENEFGIKNHQCIAPIGMNSSDTFFDILSKVSGKDIPLKYKMQRGRLLDSYADGHKYIFGKKAVVYGEEDLVLSLCSFLDEIGIEVVLAASGANSGKLRKQISKHCPEHGENIQVMSDSDFEQINEACNSLSPDFLIGNSKGNYIANNFNIPLIRVGFPIHDRIGGQRISLLGYKGTQDLFDKVVNAMIEYKQNNSPIGYKYM